MQILPTGAGYRGEPIRGDLPLMLTLAALAPFGLLIWTGLFLAVKWSLLMVPRRFAWAETWSRGQPQVELASQQVDHGLEVADRAVAAGL